MTIMGWLTELINMCFSLHTYFFVVRTQNISFSVFQECNTLLLTIVRCRCYSRALELLPPVLLKICFL